MSKPKTSLRKDDSPFDGNQKYDSILSKQKKSDIKIEEEPPEGPGNFAANDKTSSKTQDRVSGQQILKPKIHNIEIECQDIFNKNSSTGDYNVNETTKGQYKDGKFVKSRQSSMRIRQERQPSNRIRVSANPGSRRDNYSKNSKNKSESTNTNQRNLSSQIALPGSQLMEEVRKIPLNLHGTNLSTTELPQGNLEPPISILNQNKSVNFFESRQQKRQTAKIRKYQ